jgi:hypothetical protein
MSLAVIIDYRNFISEHFSLPSREQERGRRKRSMSREAQGNYRRSGNRGVRYARTLRLHGEVMRELSSATLKRIILIPRDENQSSKFERYNFYRSLIACTRVSFDK